MNLIPNSNLCHVFVCVLSYNRLNLGGIKDIIKLSNGESLSFRFHV